MAKICGKERHKEVRKEKKISPKEN